MADILLFPVRAKERTELPCPTISMLVRDYRARRRPRGNYFHPLPDDLLEGRDESPRDPH